MRPYKRLFAWILTVVMVLGMFPPLSVSAAEVDGTAQTTEAPAPAPVPVPAGEPTSEPAGEPTSEPTEAPTSEPTETPTSEPTEAPTSEPTEAPTSESTEAPASEPTEASEPEPTGEETGESEFTGTCIPDAELPSSQELTEAYIFQLFFGSQQTYGTAGREQLTTDQERSLYDTLKAGIQAVAAGNSGSAVFSVEGDALTVTAASAEEANQLFEGQFNKVITALLHDCPYELYWYDKTQGVSYRGTTRYAGDQYTLTGLTVSFQVAGNHQASGYNPENPAVNTATASSTVTAANTARRIVTENAGKSDSEKLTAYKEAICGLVSYNHSAAESGNFSNDDSPWQLIYVFDNNPDTNVVCEGYSKAFQYLCDESSFTNAACYTVTGEMNGGAHMWNIVRLGDRNYLADVTNSDDGTVGGLFLCGVEGSVASGYTAGVVTYVYDSVTLASWGENVLTLSDTAFGETASETGITQEQFRTE